MGRFCCLRTQFFFVILEVCWTVCLFHFLNLESLKRIYASLFTFRDFRHRCGMILKTLKHAKTVERNSIYNMWMHFSPSCCQYYVNVNVVKTIYCQCNSVFLRQKNNYSIHYLTGQNWGLSGLKNIWPVIMTGDPLSVIFSPNNEYWVSFALWRINIVGIFFV